MALELLALKPAEGGASVSDSVRAALGEAHNFDGFPSPAPPPAGNGGDEAAAGQAAQAAAEAAAAEELKSRMDALALASEAAVSAARAARVEDAAAPLRRVLLEQVMPTVVSALRSIADGRPARPLHELAAALAAAADAEEASLIDPYSNPSYEIQLGKIKAKEEREAARAAAAIAKAERERELLAAGEASAAEAV